MHYEGNIITNKIKENIFLEIFSSLFGHMPNKECLENFSSIVGNMLSMEPERIQYFMNVRKVMTA